MSISRRSFLKGSALAASLGAIGSVSMARAASHALSAAAARGVSAVSGAGDVVGKVTVGYQGWFACIGDGSPIDAWWHWSENEAVEPSPSNSSIKAWPDMSAYQKTYPTGFAALNGGGAANLYSNFDQGTINQHFQWMQQNGIDTAALQRFDPDSNEGPIRDVVAASVRTAAETYGRKFYIMYDVTGWTDMQTQMQEDWTSKMSAYTASPAYAMQNGKPVVCIWGFGFNDDNHPFDADTCAAVIAWFQSQGVYLIGGVPTNWRTGVAVRPDFLPVFHSFDMLSPWMIGAIGTIDQANAFAVEISAADKADCDANGVDYQPCILPGDLSGTERLHGNFMWTQFYNLASLGVAGFYISMFDEFNEGNQIISTAATQADVPAGSGFQSLDEDGTPCSSDYYMRLTTDGGRMLKGQIGLTAVRPTAPVVGSSVGVATVISFMSQADNLYVTAEDDGAQSLIANRTAIGQWEQFSLVDAGLGNGDAALLSHANGMYVTAGAQPLIANSTTIGQAQTFHIEVQPNTGGAVALLARANGLYVTATNAGQGPLNAQAQQVGGWELYNIYIS